jgi:uncharacterized SAM-binding protein YcdF (DUF218 family)
MDESARLELILILGAANAADGTLHHTAIERCAAACEILREAPECRRIVLSGGHAPHFNIAPLPHHAYCRRWLLEQPGVEPRHIVHAVDSANTVEDALMLRAFVDATAPRCLYVLTSTFHVARAAYIFQTVYPNQKMCFVAVPTDVADIAERTAHERRRLLAMISEGVPGLEVGGEGRR